MHDDLVVVVCVCSRYAASLFVEAVFFLSLSLSSFPLAAKMKSILVVFFKQGIISARRKWGSCWRTMPPLPSELKGLRFFFIQTRASLRRISLHKRCVFTCAHRDGFVCRKNVWCHSCPSTRCRLFGHPTAQIVFHQNHIRHLGRTRRWWKCQNRGRTEVRWIGRQLSVITDNWGESGWAERT